MTLKRGSAPYEEAMDAKPRAIVPRANLELQIDRLNVFRVLEAEKGLKRERNGQRSSEF